MWTIQFLFAVVSQEEIWVRIDGCQVLFVAHISYLLCIYSNQSIAPEYKGHRGSGNFNCYYRCYNRYKGTIDMNIGMMSIWSNQIPWWRSARVQVVFTWLVLDLYCELCPPDMIMGGVFKDSGWSLQIKLTNSHWVSSGRVSHVVISLPLTSL